MPQKLKEHHTKAFAEHHEHAAKHHRKAVIAASVCDHRLGYQHARPTDIIAVFNFLHHIFADDFQQTLFAFGHSAWLDIEDAERANRKVVAAEGNAGVKAQAALF
jgi:hypothetical protein